MKFSFLSITSAVLLFISCSKDKIITHVRDCETYTELTDRSNLADPASLGSQKLMDYLAAHPELQVYQTHSENIGWVAKCNVFYGDLKVFSDQLLINCYKGSDSLVVYDTLDYSNIHLSLSPQKTYTEAIQKAREVVDFRGQCLSWRLGLYDINALTSNMSKEYKLVWKVQTTDNGAAWAIIDANTLEVYYKTDGIVY